MKNKPVNRRSFLKAAGTAAAGVVGGTTIVKRAMASLKSDEEPPPSREIWQRLEMPSEDEVNYKEFDIDIQIARHELITGMEVHALAFNGQVPGPEFRVQEGDWVKVNFTNKTDLLHTIHWHGLEVPYEMDGVPYVTQQPVMPNQTFVYKFRAQPHGTHFYHCHFGTTLHMQMAMHGAFIVERKDDPIREQFPYERDYTLVLSSFDTNFARAELNRMLERMKQRKIMMKQGTLTNRTLGVFNDYDTYLKEVKQGYLSPYTTMRHQGDGAIPNYNFFAINGKSYPATEHLKIKTGEWIRIRMINGGMLEHYMHLHGHDFYKVADDGAPLANPVKMNTVRVSPGKTVDIVLEGYNPGYWTFHDHDTSRATNNGIYPGGILTLLEYEDIDRPDFIKPGYIPKVALDE